MTNAAVLSALAHVSDYEPARYLTHGTVTLSAEETENFVAVIRSQAFDEAIGLIRSSGLEGSLAMAEWLETEAERV